MRKLRGWRAFLASIAGVGLGYLYVGRIRLAFIVPLAILAAFAFAGWTRLILEPRALYGLALIFVLAGLVPVVHPIVLARAEKEAPSSRLNRGWVYIVWIILSYPFSGWLLDVRATAFGFEPFRVRSVSMSPAIEPGDMVMVDTWRFRNAHPEHGDLIVFTVPDGNGLRYLFRVVGVPGDTIELRNAVLYRNNLAVDEPYVNIANALQVYARDYGPIELGDASVFVLGDNRDNARDSRFIGPVPLEMLHGRVEHRWFAYRDGVRWERFPQLLADDGA